MRYIEHKRSAAVCAWIRRELEEQRQRYRRIVAEMDALAPERERWIAAFLERIQTSGFNAHKDIKRKVKPEEIPRKPRRKHKVVF